MSYLARLKALDTKPLDLLNKWDRRFMALAQHVAGWSKDPSTNCGAVVVPRSRTPIIFGYNGLPPGISDDDRLHDRDWRLAVTLHAEDNAVANAGLDGSRGATLYVWPMPPCSRCAARIIRAGIIRVVAQSLSDLARDDRWRDSVGLGLKLFAEAGVDFTIYRG